MQKSSSNFLVTFPLFLLITIAALSLLIFRDLISPYYFTAIILFFIYLYYGVFFLIPKIDEIDSPFSIGFGLLTLYSIGGFVVYALRDIYWFNYAADMETATQSVLLAQASMLVGRMIAHLIRVHRPSLKCYMEFVPKRLLITTLVFIGIGNVAALFLYDFYANAPIFAGNIDMARQQLRIYSAGRGSLFILQLLLVVAVPLVFYAYRNISRKTKLLEIGALLFACLIPLSLYGGRFFVLFPFVLSMVMYSVYFKKIQMRTAFIIAVLALSIAMLFVAYRNFGPTVDLYYGTRAIWSDIFPEVRNFALIAHNVGSPQLYKEISVNFISTLFPSSVLSAIGLDKKYLLFNIGEFVAYATGFNVPIRTGLVGEAYLAYGNAGEMVIFTGLGLVLGMLNKIINWFRSRDARKLVIVVLSTFLAISIPYGTNMFSTTIFATIFTLIAVYLGSKVVVNTH